MFHFDLSPFKDALRRFEVKCLKKLRLESNLVSVQ